MSSTDPCPPARVSPVQISKIGKVMRKIAALPEIPREEEFKFKQRAHALIGKVRRLLICFSALARLDRRADPLSTATRDPQWQIQLTSAGTNEEGGQTNGNGTHDE